MRKLMLSLFLGIMLVLSVGLVFAQSGSGNSNNRNNMYQNNGSEDELCCYIYGFGTNMTKNGYYKWTDNESCQTPENFVGGGKEVVDDDMCENRWANKTGNGSGLGQIIRNRVRAGIYTSPEGEQIRVRDLAQNRLRIEVGNGSVDCDCGKLNLTQEDIQNRTRLRAQLSNGRNTEVKIMPNVASERALERLRLKRCNNTEVNCSIELKEVGQGNQTKLAYEMKARKAFKILGFIKNRENIALQIDAETGEEIGKRGPWWAWLASEEDDAEKI